MNFRINFQKKPKYVWVSFFLVALAATWFWYSSNKQFVTFWFIDHTRSKSPETILIGSSSVARLPTSLLTDCNSVQSYGFNNAETDTIQRYLNFAKIPETQRVLLYIGENDITRGKSVQQTFDEYQSIIWKIKELTSATIGIVTLKPSPARHSVHHHLDEFNELLKSKYEDDKNISFVPYHTFSAENLYIEDKIHLNKTGTERLVKLINTFCREN